MSKKKSPPELWENNGKNNKFVRLFVLQLESDAFKRLNSRQRTLYVYMKAQYNGKNNSFCFSWYMANKKYNLYTNQKTFYDDIKKLEEWGFIKCLENNRNLRKKNIYCFSEKWTTL